MLFIRSRSNLSTLHCRWRTMSTMSCNISPLPISKPSLEEENVVFQQRKAEMAEFFALPRFQAITRPYTPADVASKQGSMPVLPMPSTLLANKLFTLLSNAAETGKPLHTMGAIDPVQMTQMARHQDVVYVSGWAASSLLTTANNEVGPDLGDYPYTTVPNQVHRIFRAQQLHDRKHYDERVSATPEQRAKMEYIDYLNPIVADADTGHGGLSAVMKLAKLFAESGVSGIHLEDQLHGGKKCGHLGGKVLVPTSTHVSRLVASRFQLDLLKSTMLLIARTDSESGKLLSSNIDIADHEYIIGTSTKDTRSLAQVLAEAGARGATGAEINRLEKEWMESHEMCTFNEAVEKAINRKVSIKDKKGVFETYTAAVAGKSNNDAREVAADILGEPAYWDWDLPRTKEGYYHYTGGVEAAIKRTVAFAPYADLLWLETKTPNLEQARYFSRKIREKYPEKYFVYNLSPSFNWSQHGFTDKDLKNFVWDLAKEGFLLQIISLAGLHSNAAATAELAARFKEDGMLAYVELVQRKEKEIGCDVLTHQKWSGANYIDRILQTVSSGSSISQLQSAIRKANPETVYLALLTGHLQMMDADVLPEIITRHPLVSLVSACFWVILWLLSWMKSLVAFATITVPKYIYAVLSYSMTLTLNFWNFVAIFILSAIALNYWIRFRYLNDYTQLKEPPLVKPDANELHPDINTDPPPSFHNYLDDFLQAVRVFGFLEKPVFHELARHLQTRRLIAGDSISLDEDKSFYCVVDGMVQVYAQTEQAKEGRHRLWDDEDMNGYQLLNEVGAGGTLSSLFTILSLFTEDVKMSWQGEDPDVSSDDVAEQQDEVTSLNIPSRVHRTDPDIPQLDLEPDRRTRPRRSSVSSTASTVHPVGTESPTRDRYHSGSRSDTSAARTYSFVQVDSKPPAPAHRAVVARAIEDTTLAVIPAEAFRRLTKKFPKATGHVVQVILTRFSRVTFNAAHKYLGLTREVLRTEKAINDIACHPLPASFYEGGGLQYLRHRFDGAVTSASETENDYFSISTSPGVMSPGSLMKDKGSRSSVSSSEDYQKTPSSPFRGARRVVQAGDLLVAQGRNNDNVRQFNRSFSILNSAWISRGTEPVNAERKISQSNKGRTSAEDFDLREEVMSCIAKSIGLLQPPLSGSDSVEASPALHPFDHQKMAGSFDSPFGSLSLLDGGDDTSSATGSSSVTASDSYMKGLDNEVEILFYAAGTTLVKAGEHNTGLFYVIEGFLDILLPETRQSNYDVPMRSGSREPDFISARRTTSGSRDDSTSHKLLFTVKPGGIAGYLSSLCNTASYVDICAKTDTYVGFLPYHALERLLEKRPIVLLTLAKRLISLLSPLVLHIDASLDWMQVNAGQVLWRPNDISDSFYIVINGRLRAITETENGGVNIEGEYGQGDTVGELDVITSCPRRNTVHAIRDTELVRMPQTLFNAISARNPQTTAQLLKMIASRVRDEVDSSSTSQGRTPASELGRNNTNLKTVAVLPVTRNVPVYEFARKLQSALEGIGASTAFLNQASISSHLGRHAFTRMGKLKSAGWLADQEQRYRLVLYVADSPVNSSWTQTCVRQADCVMIVGMGDDPSLGEYERLLLSMKTTARKELILLHPDRSVIPGSTREWLKNRSWVHQHIHVELPGLVLPISKSTSVHKDPDAVTALKNLKDKVQSGIQKYRGGTTDPRPQRPPHMNDFSRLARRICGKSIGLVLGGGGARGIAHLGLIRALEERGIPIDHVAGTSIGALIGGLYAREGDLISASGRAKQFSGRMGNIWRILSDVTYPLVAYTTGHEFNRSIYKAFYDLHIEDMWLPYFCNTTNIISSQMEVHQTGYAWRFIRASMSLVGLLPPLCDNGKLLVDGGYLDNLPVSTMFSMGASTVFASDVGSIDDNSPRNFGDTISGWWLLVNRWNPFSNARHVPAITEIQSRLAYVSSVRTLEEVKVAKGCMYIPMPVQEYGTLQFGKYEEIRKKGYLAAIEVLEKLSEEDRLPCLLVDSKDASGNSKKKGQSARRYSI
ncbi:hypothetical protein AX17_000383 [Amanita inopinata Kibby_2008]|nr:hypothetical protein AX17_000383 [Amanita inopinata Kibby_2008]